MNDRRPSATAGVAVCSLVLLTACGGAADGDTIERAARSETSEATAPPDTSLARCETPDGTTTDGVVSVRLEAPAEPIPTTIGHVELRVTVTNTADKAIRINGREGDRLHGFVTADSGEIISAPPPVENLAKSSWTLQPGKSLEWPVTLWLERCGVPRGQELEPGIYGIRVLVDVDNPDASDNRELLSSETVPIELIRR